MREHPQEAPTGPLQPSVKLPAGVVASAWRSFCRAHSLPPPSQTAAPPPVGLLSALVSPMLVQTFMAASRPAPVAEVRNVDVHEEVLAVLDPGAAVTVHVEGEPARGFVAECVQHVMVGRVRWLVDERLTAMDV